MLTAKTEISFVDGVDGVVTAPEIAQKAHLTLRFAVIQETYRSDSVDMYFDEALWTCIADYARRFCRDAQVKVAALSGQPEQSLESFLAAWAQLDPSDREPPELMLVRCAGELALCVATEFWCRIGGPQPYADSYTYSLHSKSDISREVMDFLAKAEAASGWQLATAPTQSVPK
jgi:hypothetical protein